MGKHPVSTTIKLALNKEVDDICDILGCSKYAFIEEAIKEKVEKSKIERIQEKKRDSSGANRQSQDGIGSGEEIINDVD